MRYADRLARLRELSFAETARTPTDKTDKSPPNAGTDPLLSVLSVPLPAISEDIAAPEDGHSREERARLIAAEIAGRIRAVAPVGLGHWPYAWELVASPTDALLDAVHAWEAAGDGADREEALRAAVNAAAARAVAAWREAARRWEAAGRPGTLGRVEQSAGEAVHVA